MNHQAAGVIKLRACSARSMSQELASGFGVAYLLGKTSEWWVSAWVNYEQRLFRAAPECANETCAMPNKICRWTNVCHWLIIK